MRYLLILLLLAGCATPEKRAERDINRFGPYCEKLGFEKDSNDWRYCVAQNASEARSRPGWKPTRQVCNQVGNQQVCNTY